MKLVYTIFLLLAIASTAIAESKEIRYGKEEIAISDQMGLDNHYKHFYQQRFDITLSPLDKPENPGLMLSLGFSFHPDITRSWAGYDVSGVYFVRRVT